MTYPSHSPTGVQIIKHALRMVIDNIGPAVRITGPVYLCVALIGYVLPGVLGLPNLAQLAQSGVQPDGRWFVFMLAMLFSLVVLLPLIAVLWHRFVLLDGDEKRDSAANLTDALRRYVLRAVTIFLAVLGLFVVIVLILGVIAQIFGAAGVIALQLFAMLFVTYFVLRVSLGLPAAAIGGSIGLRDSWELTGRLGQQFWVIVLLQVAIMGVLGLIPYVGILLNWFSLLLSASILTTLYGVLVEGRELSRA